MGKGANGVFFNFFSFFVQGVFYIFPLIGFNLNFQVIAGAFDVNDAVINFGDFANFAIVIALVMRNVVFDKHDLRLFFELQHFVRGIRKTGKIASHAGAELLHFSRQFG